MRLTTTADRAATGPPSQPLSTPPPRRPLAPPPPSTTAVRTRPSHQSSRAAATESFPIRQRVGHQIAADRPPLSLLAWHFLSLPITSSLPLSALSPHLFPFSQHQPELKLHALFFFAFCFSHGLFSFLVTMLTQLSGSALDSLYSPG